MTSRERGIAIRKGKLKAAKARERAAQEAGLSPQRVRKDGKAMKPREERRLIGSTVEVDNLKGEIENLRRALTRERNLREYLEGKLFPIG